MDAYIICHNHRYRLITGKDPTRFIISSAHRSTVNCHSGEAYRVTDGGDTFILITDAKTHLYWLLTVGRYMTHLARPVVHVLLSLPVYINKILMSLSPNHS